MFCLGQVLDKIGSSGQVWDRFMTSSQQVWDRFKTKDKFGTSSGFEIILGQV